MLTTIHRNGHVALRKEVLYRTAELVVRVGELQPGTVVAVQYAGCAERGDQYLFARKAGEWLGLAPAACFKNFVL